MHLDYLEKLLAMGAKNYIDILGHHFYVPRDAPEAMVPLIRDVQRIMQKKTASKPSLAQLDHRDQGSGG